MSRVHEVIESTVKATFETELNDKINGGWSILVPMNIHNDSVDITTYRALVFVDSQTAEPV